MHQDALNNLGLSPEESATYLSLLNNGPQSASALSSSTKVKRTYVYAVCKSLINQGLIKEEKKGKTTTFSALSPDHLLTLAEDQKQKAVSASKTLEQLLPILKTKYAGTQVRPVVSYYEGIEGIKKIYDDLIATGQDFFLFRSIYDENHPELGEVVARQLKRQVENKIHVRTITPLEPQTKTTFLNLDKSRLVKRHIVRDPNFLKLPSQIIIYGSKVALISLKDPHNIISTLIDNKEISQTFIIIFEHIWQTSAAEHEGIIAEWQKTGAKLPPIPTSN